MQGIVNKNREQNENTAPFSFNFNADFTSLLHASDAIKSGLNKSKIM
jgi:hypothetical protein